MFVLVDFENILFTETMFDCVLTDGTLLLTNVTNTVFARNVCSHVKDHVHHSMNT